MVTRGYAAPLPSFFFYLRGDNLSTNASIHQLCAAHTFPFIILLLRHCWWLEETLVDDRAVKLLDVNTFLSLSHVQKLTSGSSDRWWRLHYFNTFKYLSRGAVTYLSPLLLLRFSPRVYQPLILFPFLFFYAAEDNTRKCAKQSREAVRNVNMVERIATSKKINRLTIFSFSIFFVNRWFFTLSREPLRIILPDVNNRMPVHIFLSLLMHAIERQGMMPPVLSCYG